MRYCAHLQCNCGKLIKNSSNENKFLCFPVVAGLFEMRWMNVWCINVLLASLVDSVLCQCLNLHLSSVPLQLFFL